MPITWFPRGIFLGLLFVFQVEQYVSSKTGLWGTFSLIWWRCQKRSPMSSSVHINVIWCYKKEVKSHDWQANRACDWVGWVYGREFNTVAPPPSHFTMADDASSMRWQCWFILASFYLQWEEVETRHPSLFVPVVGLLWFRYEDWWLVSVRLEISDY